MENATKNLKIIEKFLIICFMFFVCAIYLVSSPFVTIVYADTSTRVVGWGYDGEGNLGQDIVTKNYYYPPVEIKNLGQIKDIATGGAHGLALKSDGTVWSWGLNTRGQLGDGTSVTRATPIQVIDPSDPTGFLTSVKSIYANDATSFAIKNDGTVWFWGYASFSGPYSGTSNNPRPIKLKGPGGLGYLTGIVDIAIGNEFYLALKSDGTVWGWGLNGDGELGVNPDDDYYEFYPIHIPNISLVKKISAGWYHALALKSDGSVWSWGANIKNKYGDNLLGLLGDGADEEQSYLPVKVKNLSNTIMISAEKVHNLALKSDGTVWGWGGNNNGELGIGIKDQEIVHNIPEKVKNPDESSGYLKNIQFINAGDRQSQAIDKDGKVWAWGFNPKWLQSVNYELYPLNLEELKGARIIKEGDNFSLGLFGNPTSGLPLIDFKQNRNADGSYKPWALDRLFNLNSCSTLAREGCAITVFADVLASYQLKNLPDKTTVDPGHLNNYFANNPGSHSGCLIYFNTAGRVVNYNVLHNDFSWMPLSTRIKHIDDALNTGNLVIAGTGGHYVVLYQKGPDAVDGSPDYFIADPFRYVPYAAGDRSGKLLSQAYKTVNQLANDLQVVVIENKAPKPGKSWVVVAHSPVELLITDPDGNKTGYDPATKSFLQDISESSYGLQKGLIDDENVMVTQDEVKYFGQNILEDGKYTIQVIGIGIGPYTLDFGVASGPDDSFLQSISGIAVEGQIDTFQVNASSGNSLVISRKVKVDVKPNNENNILNFKSKGVIPVAILSTATFDAANVNPFSIRFNNNEIDVFNRSNIEDVDGDGRLDMIFHFDTQKSGITPEEKQVCLAGKLKNGESIEGCDKIQVL